MLSLHGYVHVSDAGYIPSENLVLMQIQYREHWLEVLFSIFDEPPTVLHRGGLKQCELWSEFSTSVIKRVGGKIGCMENIKKHIESFEPLISDCSYCQIRASMWIGVFSKKTAAIPKFSTLL